jgi:hypothetical protein
MGGHACDDYDGHDDDDDDDDDAGFEMNGS